MQQYLPFTVLKPAVLAFLATTILVLQQYLPFTVLKQAIFGDAGDKITQALQQYLPFTVLKPEYGYGWGANVLQQYLPFTVLKLPEKSAVFLCEDNVATVLTVYGIETRGILGVLH